MKNFLENYQKFYEKGLEKLPKICELILEVT
jgi:hypothetical protein